MTAAMYTSHDLTVLVPVLRRPHRVTPLLASVRATVPAAHVVFIASPGDITEHEAVRAEGAELLVMPTDQRRGDYAKKIQAGYEATTEPLLFLAADDLLFHPGWFETAAACITDTVQVVGTNDLTNQRTVSGDHSTHTLLTRRYVQEWGTIDRPGQVLHDGYIHEYVDDELVGTAKRRGMYAHAHDAVVEHLHPMAGKSPTDPIYQQQQARMHASRRLYLKRKPLWT